MKSIKLLLMIGFLSTFVINAQTPSYFKIKDDGWMYKIISVSTSGYLTVGTNTSQGVENVQLVKWNSSFDEEWSYEFANADITAANSLIFIKESRFGSFYFCAPTPAGNAVVFKISSTGNVIWQTEYSVSGFVIASTFHIAPEGDDGFIFGTGSCTVSNGVVKCDANGDIEWQRTFSRSDATGVATCSGIVNTGNGYIITSKFNGDSFVNFEVDALGVLISDKAYKNNSKSMSVTKSIVYGNGIALLGNYNSSNGNIDKFICLVDNTLTQNVYCDLVMADGTSSLYLNDFTVDGTGQFLLVNGETYSGAPSRQVMLSFNSLGDFSWKKKTISPGGFQSITAWSDRVISVGGANYEPVVSIIDNTGNGLCDEEALDLNNLHPNLTLLGGTTSEFASTSFSGVGSNYLYTNNISFSRTMICGSAPVGIELSEIKENISIQPNPVKEIMTLNFDGDLPSKINVMDLSGKLILSNRPTTDQLNLNIEYLPAGLYVIQFFTTKGVTTEKFIKE